jgi:hypothetical protein
MRLVTVERLARALHAADVKEYADNDWSNTHKPVTDDWDFGPAEYMRHLYRERAERILDMMGRH